MYSNKLFRERKSQRDIYPIIFMQREGIPFHNLLLSLPFWLFDQSSQRENPKNKS